MKKLTALLSALLALALVTGPAIAADTMGGGSAAPMMGKELRKQLSPNIVGFGYRADGVSDEEFTEPIDRHYGVAPMWEDRAEVTLTTAEKAEIELGKLLSPNAYGFEAIADGVRDVDRGLVDKHYGVAPAWEDRSESITETELGKHLSPNAFGFEPIAD